MPAASSPEPGRDRAGVLHHSYLYAPGTRPDVMRKALQSGADVVLLDNMDSATLREAVALVSGRLVTEASGNMRLDRIAEVAATGVDYISSGALTHSAQTLDLGLDF